MKVAQVCHRYLPCIGGIELYVYRLTEDLRKRGMHTEVLTTDLETPLEGRRKEAKYFKASFSFMRNPFSFELLRHLRENRYDLLHVHNIWFMPGFLAALYRKGAKVVTSLHGVYPDRTNFWQSFFLRMYKPLAQYVLNKSDRIIVADGKASRLVKIFKINPAKIIVIPNGIRLASYKPCPKENIILFSGRIIPDKNPDVLIKAAGILNRKFGDFQLVFLGQVEKRYKQALTRLVRACRLEEKVIFLGPLSQAIPAQKEKLMNIYKKSYAFVSLGSWEGIPTRLMEAMQFEVPCIAFEAGGSSALIRDQDNGLILKTLDENLLADKLYRLFQDRALAKRLGARARLTIKRNFNWPRLSNKLMDVYQEISSR
jgi:glycosyltransferase involved in cell wall biosynthesis